MVDNALAAHQQEVAQVQQLLALYGRNLKYALPAQTYQTTLPPKDETTFRAWVSKGRIPFDPDDPMSDYDMRAYWQALQRGAAAGTGINPNDGKLHYPDTYKTPYHHSFSAESRYAAPNAPVWINDHQLADPKTGEVIFDERARR